jgi:hypothetical protein
MPSISIPLFLTSLALLSGTTTVAWPDQAAPPSSAPPPSCQATQFHQFDFWIGEWDVFYMPERTHVGHHVIERVASGCGIDEHWTGLAGSGRSLSAYSYDDARWHQFWISSGASAVSLTGGLEGTAMVLSNAGTRITYTPNKDGTVRLVWKKSSDGGKTWEQVSDSLYTRAPAATRRTP